MRYFSILFIFLLISACNGDREGGQNASGPGSVLIKGKLDNGAGLLLTLDRMEPTSFVPVDSASCDENGEFLLTFSTAKTEYYALKYTPHGYVTLIASPGDIIELYGSGTAIHPYSLKGSPDSELIQRLSFKHKEVLDEMGRISEINQAIIGSPDYLAEKSKLNLRYDSLTSAFHVYSERFIKGNPDSPAILLALYNQYGPDLPVFDPLTDMITYEFVDSCLQVLIPENNAVKALHSMLNMARQQTQNQQKKKQLTAGMKAPDFVINTLENTPVTLTELRGSYILLQFWASWSSPSVEENKFLKKAMDLFGAKNFEILQISIDENKDEWIRAIDHEMRQWLHTSELKRWQSAVIDLYGIERIPANFLINPEGIIVETDIFGPSLEKTLKKYLN